MSNPDLNAWRRKAIGRSKPYPKPIPKERKPLAYKLVIDTWSHVAPRSPGDIVSTVKIKRWDTSESFIGRIVRRVDGTTRDELGFYYLAMLDHDRPCMMVHESELL